MTGFLSPDGTFIACNIGSHAITAQEIYENITGNKLRDVAKELNSTFVDCFMNVSDWLINLDFIYFSDILDGEIYFPLEITDEQMRYILEHLEQFSISQKEALVIKLEGEEY